MRNARERSRASLISLRTIFLAGALVMHSLAARTYYNLQSLRLQLIAATAVSAGVQYLPAAAQAAERAADRYVRLNGRASDEVVFTGVSPDHRSLTIQLMDRIPWYMLPLFPHLLSGEIRVTATARRPPPQTAPAGKGARYIHAIALRAGSGRGTGV